MTRDEAIATLLLMGGICENEAHGVMSFPVPSTGIPLSAVVQTATAARITVHPNGSVTTPARITVHPNGSVTTGSIIESVINPVPVRGFGLAHPRTYTMEEGVQVVATYLEMINDQR